jgi:RND family efflux transporter MFP subunit
MIRKYVLPGLAAAGVAFGLFTSLRGGRELPAAPPVAAPAAAPYRTFVAGAGIVESSTENIAIGTPIAGIVAGVNVTVGTVVETGVPLFKIDDRLPAAELAVREAEVQVAEAQLADARNQLRLAESLGDKRAISVEELDRRRFAVDRAAAELAQARAVVESARTHLDMLTVRAPVAGQVLQVNVRVGEFAHTGAPVVPLILLGSVAPLHIRVDVDETDAWRVRAGAPAIAVLRGNSDIQTPLQFVRFEPYVVPKRSLTGESTERVDTRVLQVIYSFPRGDLPIFVGQQMDVFIEAPGHAEAKDA